MGFRLDNENSIVPEATLEFHNSKFRGPKIFEIFLVKPKSKSDFNVVMFSSFHLAVYLKNSATRGLVFSSPRTIYLVKNSQTFTEDAQGS